MSTTDPHIRQQLVEYALGLLEAGEESRIEQLLSEDPRLRRELARIRAGLAPLAAWVAPEPRADAVDRIMQSVQAAAPLHYVAAGSATQFRPRRRLFASVRELVALAACLVILLGVFNMGTSQARSRKQRNTNDTQLASIFSGASQYATAFRDQMTRWVVPGGADCQQQPGVIHPPGLRYPVTAVRVHFVLPGNMAYPARLGSEDRTPDGDSTGLPTQVRPGASAGRNRYTPVPSLRARIVLPVLADAATLFDDADMQLAPPAEPDRDSSQTDDATDSSVTP